ncbi:MAG TPA: AbrB/MazE/SpoVT family DNA-binding domain-containing protein [Terriglobales bacterium]|nr:AbrB/MazE/SpoVT family DNA-binding domain-containing protein [Terriglobales bacterium]
MNTRLSIDRAGRVVLPKPIRDRLQLEPGESLEIESFEDHIVLRPIREHATMRKELGVLVFDTGEPITASEVRETIQKIRDERSDRVLGIKR